MSKSATDPTVAMKVAAAEMPNVTVGTACNQASYKLNKKSFFFIGPQGGRYKAMFKLKDSLAQARQLAQAQPDAFEVGKLDWVTARFTSEKPLAKSIWSKWLKESYQEFSAPAVSTGKKKKSSKKKKTTVTKKKRKKKNTKKLKKK